MEILMMVVAGGGWILGILVPNIPEPVDGSREGQALGCCTEILRMMRAGEGWILGISVPPIQDLWLDLVLLH